MSKKDFFIIIIKLFGLNSLINFIFFLPNNFSFAFSIGKTDEKTIIWAILSIVIMFGLFVLLIFNAHNVVKILKLDKGFDDNHIDFANFDLNNIVKLAMILIGGFLIINNISTFLSHSLHAFKDSAIGKPYNFYNKFKWFLSGLNILVGYLLISNYKAVSRMLKISNSDEPSQK